MRSGFPRFSPENITANLPIVDLLKQFAEKKKATPAQISLAWFSRKSHGLFRFPAHAEIDHLNENLGAINVELTPADLREIESAFSAVSVQGERLSEKHLQQIDQS